MPLFKLLFNYSSNCYSSHTHVHTSFSAHPHRQPPRLSACCRRIASPNLESIAGRFLSQHMRVQSSCVSRYPKAQERPPAACSAPPPPQAGYKMAAAIVCREDVANVSVPTGIGLCRYKLPNAPTPPTYLPPTSPPLLLLLLTLLTLLLLSSLEFNLRHANYHKLPQSTPPRWSTSAPSLLRASASRSPRSRSNSTLPRRAARNRDLFLPRACARIMSQTCAIEEWHGRILSFRAPSSDS